MLFSVESYRSLPQEPGIYLFLDHENNIIYVGKAKNLRSRVSSYFINKTTLYGKTKVLVSKVVKIRIIVVQSELESLLLEANFIKKYTPKYNIRLTDGKAYPFIRITHDTYPVVLTARHTDDPQSLYFGPYPNTRAMRYVLTILRRLFPFQAVKNHPKKMCFYYHLQLCPCPSVFDSKELRKEYHKTIRYIRHFLSGDTKKVVKELEQERDKLSADEKFEKAQKIQQKIDAITLITNPFHKPFEYETNPHLKTDIRKQETDELLTLLQAHTVPITSVTRIECFDISNTQGTYAVASMVVFINGEKNSSQYKRFRMKTQGPNDFAMMQEVLTRRLKHSEWGMPQLLIVDGGKGQISSAKHILEQLHHDIPLIGLAKREETIITSDFQEISIPKSSPALQLVMRIRDEAHRFAITYHKKLRSRFIFD